MRTELHWIPAPASGRLAIMPRPRGSDWLADEIRSWRAAGIDIVASLLTADEITALELADEKALSEANGIQFLSFPITDRSVPPSKFAVMALVTRLAKELVDGKNIAIHCRQGVGRAGLIAAAVLIQLGIEPVAAIQQVSAARGFAIPETLEQKSWIMAFAGESKSLIAK